MFSFFREDSPSDFLVQIVHKQTGRVAAWAPGLECERHLVNELAGRLAKRLSWFQRRRLRKVIHDEIHKLFGDLKKQIR